MKTSKILQSYLALTPDAVVIGMRVRTSTEETKICYANPAYCAMLGYTAEDVIGKPVRIAHDPTAWDAFIAHVKPLFDAGEKNFHADTRAIRSDGTTFWVSISFFVVEDDETDVRYTCATFRDIGHLKRREIAAEEALAEREALLADQRRMYEEMSATQSHLLSAINSYPDPFVVYDKHQRLVVCNQAYQKAMSHTPEKIRPGISLGEVLDEAMDCGLIPQPAGDRKAFCDWIVEVHDTRPVENFEMKGDIHHRIIRTRGDNGDMVILRMDVTELVRERRTSTQIHARLLSALNAYADPFAIFDGDNRLLIWNSSYETLVCAPGETLEAGLHSKDILKIGLKSGRFGQSYVRKLESLMACEIDIVQGNTCEADVMLKDNTHYRVSYSVAANGDRVVIHQNTTALVQQTRSAKDAEERLLAAIRAYPAPFCIYDADVRLIAWNDSYAQSFSDDPGALYHGMHMAEAMNIGLRNARFPDAVGRETEWVARTLKAVEDCEPEQDLALSGDRYHRVLRSRSTNGDMVIVRLDTTELVRKSRALQEAQERLISAITAFPDPFAIYDRDLRLRHWNPAFARNITDTPSLICEGMTVREVMRLTIAAGRIPQAKGQEEAWLDTYVSENCRRLGQEDIELSDDRHFRTFRSQSESGDMLVLRLDMTETVRQRRALERYADELERANQKMTHEALHDQLTGLGNRRFLQEKFEEFSRLRAERGGEIAALHIDLDHFKQINDTIGHAAGDHVLKEVAFRIRSNLRVSDVVARIGGDEFIVLLWMEEDIGMPEQLAAALVQDLSVPCTVEGRECRFGCSVGVAKTPLVDEKDLLTHSDVALYNAKRSGRNRTSVFNRADMEEMRLTKEIADDIVRGLAAGEFVPFYQPQVDAQTRDLVGIEALARWRHPGKGILAPAHFIRVATEMNVIADIDRSIFDRALLECGEIFAAHSAYPSLSFNISAKRLEHDIINEIGDAAKTYPGEVAFELLETIFMEEESEDFLMRIDQLREFGVKIEVDDFGSGRASIVALQRIAPDRLKIDQRLVSPIGQSRSAKKLVASIVEIGHALDINVVAEGVETEEQVHLLAALGVERLQGYHIAPPLSKPELTAFLASHPLRSHAG